MEQEQAEVTNTAPAPDAPTNTTPETDAPAPSGAAPAAEKAPDPKDRAAVIKHAVEKAKAATNAAGRKIDPATGKYVPTKEQKAAAVAATSAQAAPASAQTPAAPPKVLNAPAGLTAAIKAQWGGLPPHVQEELARLDRTAAEAAGKAAQPYAEKAKFADEINAVVAPYLPMIHAEGGTPARAIADLLRTAALLRTGTAQQKNVLFQQLARQFGVQLPSQPVTGEAQQAQVPDISAHPLVQQLAQQVQTLTGHFQQQSQSQQQAAEQANAKAVQDFLGEVDAKGQPKYPLDDSLEAGFAAEIQITRTLNPTWDAKRVLEAAYDNLSWKAPQLRELRLLKQEEERRAKEAEELAKKQAAAVTVKGSGPSTSGPSKVDIKDRRAVIANAFGAVGRR